MCTRMRTGVSNRSTEHSLSATTRPQVAQNQGTAGGGRGGQGGKSEEDRSPLHSLESCSFRRGSQYLEGLKWIRRNKKEREGPM